MWIDSLDSRGVGAESQDFDGIADCIVLCSRGGVDSVVLQVVAYKHLVDQIDGCGDGIDAQMDSAHNSYRYGHADAVVGFDKSCHNIVDIGHRHLW